MIRLSTRRTLSLLGIVFAITFFLFYTNWDRTPYVDFNALSWGSAYKDQGEVVAPAPALAPNAGSQDSAHVPWVVLPSVSSTLHGQFSEPDQPDQLSQPSATSPEEAALLEFLNATAPVRSGPSVLETLALPEHFLPSPPSPSKVIVVASTQDSAPTWPSSVPGWDPLIYIVDNVSSAIHTPRNAGNEATPYLWFIVQNYDSLPDFTAFVHHHESAPHNTMFDKTTAQHLEALRLPYVKSEGFVNIRCQTNFACTDPVNLADPSALLLEPSFTADTFPKLFPGENMPAELRVACCGQFVVTREQIQKRSKEEYVRMLQWLWDCQAKAFWTGRVFEHLWQYIFNKGPVYCPEEKMCACNLYGYECEAAAG